MLCACSTPLFAGETAGHDPAQGQALAATPVHVVLLNQELKSQIPYLTYSMPQPTLYNAMNNSPDLSTGENLAVGAVGGAIASVIVNASMFAAAKSQVQPADAALRAAGCRLDQGQALQTTISDAVRSTPWGPAAGLTAHTLVDGQSVDDLVDKTKPRHVLAASYSMSTDFSAVITSVDVEAYSGQLPGAPKSWAKKPTWDDTLIVVSDRVEIAPKTQADIDAAIAAENARHAALDVGALIAKANAGDRVARGKVAPLIKQHQRNLRAAQATSWTPADEAVQRSRVWTAEGCARLHQAIASNATEMGGLVSGLFRGELPPRMNALPEGPRPEPVIGERKVQTEPGGVYVLTRGGDMVNLGYRYSWLPDTETDDDDNDGAGTGQAATGR